MTSERVSGFSDDGVWWMGSREELEAWKKYKKRKALAFVERGYSVSWYADGGGWMTVYLPERDYASAPELSAELKFYGKASEYGIDGGMISKLMIQERRTDILKQLRDPSKGERVRTLYNYDRGLDLDRLAASPVARTLYQIILDELN